MTASHRSQEPSPNHSCKQTNINIDRFGLRGCAVTGRTFRLATACGQPSRRDPARRALDAIHFPLSRIVPQPIHCYCSFSRQKPHPSRIPHRACRLDPRARRTKTNPSARGPAVGRRRLAKEEKRTLETSPHSDVRPHAAVVGGCLFATRRRGIVTPAFARPKRSPAPGPVASSTAATRPAVHRARFSAPGHRAPGLRHLVSGAKSSAPRLRRRISGPVAIRPSPPRAAATRRDRRFHLARQRDGCLSRRAPRGVTSHPAAPSRGRPAAPRPITAGGADRSRRPARSASASGRVGPLSRACRSASASGRRRPRPCPADPARRHG